MANRYFVYILANRRHGALYVGVTNDLARRMTEHKARLVPGFTERYGIDTLVYVEEYGSILEAREREPAVKRWRRAWKVALIEKLNPEWRDLSDQIARGHGRTPVAVPGLRCTASRCAAPGTHGRYVCAPDALRHEVVQRRSGA